MQPKGPGNLGSLGNNNELHHMFILQYLACKLHIDQHCEEGTLQLEHYTPLCFYNKLLEITQINPMKFI